MHFRFALSLAAVALLALYPRDVAARGGGGGRSFGGAGGRDFGGAGRDFGGAGRGFEAGGSRSFAGGDRGFGAGGGREFGGAGYGGFGEHTPSMSRSTSFNSVGGAGRTTAGYRGNVEGFDRVGAGNFSRPSANALGNFLNLPQAGLGGGAFAGAGVGRPGGNIGAGNIVGRGPVGAGGIAGGKGPAGGIAGSGLAGAGTGLASGKGPGNAGFGPNAGNRPANGASGQEQLHAQNIRNNVQNNHNNFYGNHNNWYNHNWWNNHGGAWNHGWNYWHGWGPGYWWNGAGWGALTGFMIGNWGQPLWYGYGTGGNVAYQGDGVYANGQYAGTPEQYYQGAQQLAATPVTDAAANGDWMPLGVFTVSSSLSDDHPVMMMQMAVNKDGNIAGMYYNTSDDVSLPIQGAVDRTTQRAAWTVGDKKNTVLETGIYNLTKEETPVLVHFGDQKTQNWLMVRLDKPAADSQDMFGPAPGSSSVAAGAGEKPAPGPPAPSDK